MTLQLVGRQKFLSEPGFGQNEENRQNGRYRVSEVAQLQKKYLGWKTYYQVIFMLSYKFLAYKHARVWAFNFFIVPKNWCFRFSAVNPFRKNSQKWGSFSTFHIFQKKSEKIIGGKHTCSLGCKSTISFIFNPFLGLGAIWNNF